MYGLVNCAIQDLVTHQFGEEAWERTRNRAGVTMPRFVAMSQYPDAVTYDLVGAASAELNLTPTQVLETFGEWWMRYSASHGYGALMDTFGRDFVEFLSSLNDLHDRLRSLFPRFQPPRLTVEILGPDRLHLHYHSHRQGLTPFVVGLVRGLGHRYHTDVTVELIRPKGPDADHDIFLITHRRQEG